MAGKILVVDDSITARKIIVNALAESEWEIIEAQDGNDGLEKLKAHPEIKVIFSDINMPWLNGLEMVEKIKENDALAQIPICMLTTETSPESLEKAKSLGVNAFLVKPVQQAQLLAVIDSFTGD